MISMRASTKFLSGWRQSHEDEKQSCGADRFRASLSRTQDERPPNLLSFNLGQQVDDKPNAGISS
jgi:hypothetical protein